MKYIINMFHLRSYCRRAQNRSLLCLLSSGVRLLRLHLESCIDKSLIYLIRILYHTQVLTCKYLTKNILFICNNSVFLPLKYYSIVPLSGCTDSSLGTFKNSFTDQILILSLCQVLFQVYFYFFVCLIGSCKSKHTHMTPPPLCLTRSLQVPYTLR